MLRKILANKKQCIINLDSNRNDQIAKMEQRIKDIWAVIKSDVWRKNPDVSQRKADEQAVERLIEEVRKLEQEIKKLKHH